MFNLFKKKQVYTPTRYDYHMIDFEWFDDDMVMKYERNTDDLDLNEEYDVKKKDFIEDYPEDAWIFRYESTEFEYDLKGNKIYDIDDDLIGEIDLKKLPDYDQMFLVFYHGKCKYHDGDDVFIEKRYSYFRLQIKKRLS